jgi:phosphopantetheinyl transferase (holo-ACP synthase)
MTKPIIRIHNVTTNEIIDREMTDDEFSAWQEEQTQIKVAEDLQAAKEAAKEAAQAKLAALGLTTDDLKALGL